MGDDPNSQETRQAPFTEGLDDWVCYSRANPLLVQITNHNISDHNWACFNLTQLETTAKTVYYVQRLMRNLEKEAVKLIPLP